MKKAMACLMLVALAVCAYAYQYEDPNYQKTADKLTRLERVDYFPSDFFFGVNETGEKNADEATFNDRRNLFYLAKNKYEKNPRSFEAVYNYGVALLSEQRVDDWSFLAAANAEQGRKVMLQAVALNPKSTQAYYRLDRALEYMLFDNERINAFSPSSPFFEAYDANSLEIYAANQERTSERLGYFGKRAKLNDRTLTPQDGHDAVLMCKALGMSEKETICRYAHTLSQAQDNVVYGSAIVTDGLEEAFKQSVHTKSIKPTPAPRKEKRGNK